MKLISYLSNGYPSLGGSRDLALRYHEAGIDAMQIDFPAADPYLEGPNIVQRMLTAREKSLDWEAYMENLAAIRKACPDLAFFLLAYEETIEEIGEDRFVGFCLAEGLLDVTFIGAGDSAMKDRLIAAGLRISCYVQFQMDRDEVAAAERGNGFVYLQAKPQVPEDQLRFPELRDCIGYLRPLLAPDRKIYTGVGIRTPQDAVLARDSGSDGVFVGSTFMGVEGYPDELREKIREFKCLCQGAAKP
jgi:tryptophan synthase alpha chain